MLVGRRDERSKTWFRADRVFHTNGKWYFHTREGIDVGPYESQLEAEIEAGMLKELIKNTQVRGESLSVLRDFILESFYARPTVERDGRRQRRTHRRESPAAE